MQYGTRMGVGNPNDKDDLYRTKQQILGRMFRTPNGVKPKIVVVSIADHNDWRKRLFDKAQLIEKFDNLTAREEAHGISK